MNKDVMRSIARAIGGRMKSVIVQVARHEASRFIRHLRDRVLTGTATEQSSAPSVLAPPAPIETPPAPPPAAAAAPAPSRSEPARRKASRPSPRRAAAKQAARGNTVASLDINTASRAELVTLPGVGPARADAIMKARPYRDPAELVDKGVVPSSVFEGLKDRIRVG